jgi:hypothetical protein
LVNRRFPELDCGQINQQQNLYTRQLVPDSGHLWVNRHFFQRI